MNSDYIIVAEYDYETDKAGGFVVHDKEGKAMATFRDITYARMFVRKLEQEEKEKIEEGGGYPPSPIERLLDDSGK